MLGCVPEAVQAVCKVETGGAGGFLSDGSGRPRILFEARTFGDATGHRFDAAHPTLSVRLNDWKLYRGGAAEYARLSQAVVLDREAALRSTSWGLFQIMGFHAQSLGYAGVEPFVAAMAAGEGQQLQAFVRFVALNARMRSCLRSLDWGGFARLYNGPLYAENQYDLKLASSFAACCGLAPTDGALRLGSVGPAVKRLQDRLAAMGFDVGVPDAVFGRATELAVKRFQAKAGTAPDGVAGPQTLRALGLGGA